MDSLGIIIVVLLFLWSITKTVEASAKKIIESQNKQTELLEDIKRQLENRSEDE